MRARIDRDKTVDFLLGLDDEQFGNIRSQNICTEPVPDLDRVYFLVTQEERHRHIVRTRDDRTDFVAFAARSDKRPPVPNRSCSHCGRTNHSVDTCFELISFPAQYARGGGRGRGSGPTGRGVRRPAAVVLLGTAAPLTPLPAVGSRSRAVAGGPPAAVHASVSDSSGNLSDQMSRLMSMLEASASHVYTVDFVAPPTPVTTAVPAPQPLVQSPVTPTVLVTTQQPAQQPSTSPSPSPSLSPSSASTPVPSDDDDTPIFLQLHS
ncbi:unnamed protein product [Cuscuta campestris]|uniref:Uncharacterized protein n=1 Tax=Cuscuta campestris TaxID=132261 RepID=A0A484KQE8_9ASTE|nr:unnamed protein product [Cuscuta campestris]